MLITLIKYSLNILTKVISKSSFEFQRIEVLKEELRKLKKTFKIIPEEENSDEFVNFYFIGMYQGKEVIYDAALYTLRLHHSSEVYELAEHKAAQKFPNFKSISYLSLIHI